MPFTPTRVAAAVLVLSLGSTLAACGSDGDSSPVAQPASALSEQSGSDAVAAAAPEAAAEEAPAAEAPAAATSGAYAADRVVSKKAAAKAESANIAKGAGKGSAGSKLSVDEAALDGRIIAYTAEQTIEVEDVGKAVSQIEAAVDAASGLIAKSERAGGGPGEPASANLKLRIPPGNFESFLARIEKVGAVLERTTTGDDVTDQVVDVRSRIASARKSVERVRVLMDRASTLRDIVALESEVSSREAELEALLARQASLKKRTDLASVTVHLQTEDQPAPPPAPEEKQKAGFVAGLDDGWGAFTGSVTVIATVLGALLPFAILLLVLSPVLLVAYRRHRTAGQLGTK
ncbi:MAG: DUF4349 domain-containing protein [Sporichthyaceae bacterium]